MYDYKMVELQKCCTFIEYKMRKIIYLNVKY